MASCMASEHAGSVYLCRALSMASMGCCTTTRMLVMRTDVHRCIVQDHSSEAAPIAVKCAMMRFT